MKSDLHIHSSCSDHSTATLEQIMARCLEEGLGCIAVTDHTTVDGARRLKDMAPFKVIIGQEVMTLDGEITGLFIEEPLAQHRPLAETVAEIRSQSGLVYIPHPCELIRFKKRLDHGALSEVIDQVDVIETFNARATIGLFNDRALALAERYGSHRGAGSDAHSAAEIGRAFVSMPDFENVDGFLDALSRGTINGSRSGLWVHIATLARKALIRLGSESP